MRVSGVTAPAGLRPGGLAFSPQLEYPAFFHVLQCRCRRLPIDAIYQRSLGVSYRVFHREPYPLVIERAVRVFERYVDIQHAGSLGLTGGIDRLITHPMLTVKQFAAKIGKSRQRVHQLMREGRIWPAPKRFGCYFLLSSQARVVTAKRT